MLVPAMKSIGMSASSRTLRTPMHAIPRAPPPLRITATLGRFTDLNGRKFGMCSEAWLNSGRIVLITFADCARASNVAPGNAATKIQAQSRNTGGKIVCGSFRIADKNYRNIDGIATKADCLTASTRSLDFRSSSRYVIQVFALLFHGVFGATQFKITEVFSRGPAAQ